MSVIPEFREAETGDLCEFEASLIYRVNSGIIGVGSQDGMDAELHRETTAAASILRVATGGAWRLGRPL